MRHRILTFALAASLPFAAATMFAQQQTTKTTSSTTRTGIDPATGQPYTAQQSNETNTSTAYDGTVRHSHVKTAQKNTTVNPDGTVSKHTAEHSRSRTVVNNPDGSTTESHGTTSKTENNTTPQ
jgi:hypothetical protein